MYLVSSVFSFFHVQKENNIILKNETKPLHSVPSCESSQNKWLAQLVPGGSLLSLFFTLQLKFTPGAAPTAQDLNVFTSYCLSASVLLFVGLIVSPSLGSWPRDSPGSVSSGAEPTAVCPAATWPTGDWGGQTTPAAATDQTPTLLSPSDKMQNTPRGQRLEKGCLAQGAQGAERAWQRGEGLLLPGRCAAAWGSCSGRR